MKIHSSAIFLLFLFASVIRCWDLEEAAEKLDHLRGIKFLRFPRDSEDESSIWLDYEFNTGAGNREDLVLTDISIHEYPSLPETGAKWQFLEANGPGYLVRTEKSTLSSYKLDLNDPLINGSINLDIEGTILTSKMISLSSFPFTLPPKIEVIAVLCVESDRGTSLQWYRLDGASFQFFWSWPVQKHIKAMEFIQHGDQNKLVLLSQDEIRFGKQFSPIDVYGFSIDFPSNAFHFWLCQRTFAPKVFDIQACSIYESIFLALQGNNEVFLYEYINTAEESIFRELQPIKSQDLKNFVCFESGYLQFLAISGPEAGMFHFFEGEFQYNSESEPSFDVSEISWVKDVRLDTYRDESLLLMQLRNSTVIALAWQGLSFKRLELPSNVLDQFDISTITVVPKFGFVVGNKFVRFHTELKKLRHPLQHTTERLLSAQHLLNDSMIHQERILNETRTRLEKSYLKNPQISGVWNISAVNATNVTITDDVVYRTVNVGPINLTREELTFDVDAHMETLEDLERKLDETDANLADALDSNTTELNFDSEIELFGNINVTGTLSVQNLTAESINDVNMMQDLRSSNENIIEDRRTFSSIQAENLNIRSINGVPVEDIRFSDSIDDYGDVDFSKINRAEVKEHLSFDTINGINWNELITNIVWKNETKLIPGDTVIEGTLTADTINIDFLNDLRYPRDYVHSGMFANITGSKSFNELVVQNLRSVKFINDIGIEDFVILYKENILNEVITFENLAVEGNLQIDGHVTGLKKQEIKLLNETSDVLSNIDFWNLTVLGNVTFDSVFVNARRLIFEDLLLKTEENVVITGTKTFLGNVGIGSNLTIQSGVINGHFMNEFVTLDTDQELPELTEILADVRFGNVTFGATKKLEDYIKKEGNSSNCLEKVILFESPIIVDELSVDSVNSIPYELFSQKLNETFQSITIENLKTETLRAEEIVPKAINGVDFANFTKHLANSNTIDEYFIDKLETDRLNVKFVNGISLGEINRLRDQLSALLFKIFEGNHTLESLQVTGKISAKTINGKKLEDFHRKDRMGTVVFKEKVSINNLTILGSINGFDFLERVSDTVLKTDRDIQILGHKNFSIISCHELETSKLNGHPVENILDASKEQVLTGPVTVNGSITILNDLDVAKSIGNIPFQDLTNRFKSLGNNTYEIRGDVHFSSNVSIENLLTNGTIQGTDFNGFLSTTISKNEDNVTISGVKVFQSPVTFKGAFEVRDRLNDVDLKRFHEKAVFVDKPFSVDSKLLFKDGLRIEKNVAVKTELVAGKLMGVDLDELRLSVLYLNRPTYIKETITVNDVTFESDIEVSKFNDLDTRLMIPLHTEQTIPVEVLKCRTVNVEEIQILGGINEQSLKAMQSTTFMLTGDQNITGRINFRGHVDVLCDFNARLINGIDPTRIVPLDSKSTLTGNFAFEKPLVLNQGLRVLGYLDGINPTWWDAVAVRTNHPLQQIISGKWTIIGNVYFEKGASGSNVLNGTNVAALSNTLATRHLEMDALIAETDENWNSICKELSQLKSNAENQIFKFSSFNYLQIIEFDSGIVSLHYFELHDSGYLLISYDTCHMHSYQFTGAKFELVANVPDFGVIERWSTFRHVDTLYFLTWGPKSCGRGPVNFWKLENNEFTHVLSLGHEVDSRRMNQDAFLTLINRHRERSMEGIHEELEKALKSSVDEDDVKIVLKGDEMLLTSRQAIYERHLDGLKNDSIGKGRPEILNFKAGLLEKDMFLYFDEEVSKDHIFICSNSVKQRRILQTIKTHKPSSFTVLNFEGKIETLLIFVENGMNLQIYEYKGIQGFLYRDTIKINVDKLIGFKIRKYSNLAKRHCLALIHENRLTILEANMYGEKLDMGTLTCS